MLTLGTGIGGGLILDGEVYRGTIGSRGELGHIVIKEDGHPCQGNCPNQGLRRDLRLRNSARPGGRRRRQARARVGPGQGG